MLGPDHTYVPPPPPVNAADVVVHVKVVEFDAVGEGGVIFCDTVVLAVAVHPLAAVTTTLYVPGAFTVGEDVVPPAVMLGPDHT
jgi:hypothetical protein